MIGILKRLKEEKRREAAERESRKMRGELIDMICVMNEQQFAWFCEKVMEVLTLDEREEYEETGKIGWDEA